MTWGILPPPGSENFLSLRHPVEYRRFLVEPDVPGQKRTGCLAIRDSNAQSAEISRPVPFLSNKFTPNPSVRRSPRPGICTKKRPLRDVPETWRGSVSLWFLMSLTANRAWVQTLLCAENVNPPARESWRRERAQAGPPRGGRLVVRPGGEKCRLDLD